MPLFAAICCNWPCPKTCMQLLGRDRQILSGRYPRIHLWPHTGALELLDQRRQSASLSTRLPTGSEHLQRDLQQRIGRQAATGRGPAD